MVYVGLTSFGGSLDRKMVGQCKGKTPGFMICCALNRHILFMCVINQRFPNMVAALEDDVINFGDDVIGKIRENAVALLFKNLSVFVL